MPDAIAPLEVFYSYADADKDLCIELDKHLSQLRRDGLITTWHKRQIIAGQDWTKVLDERLSTASIILLLVSSDFAASDYCYGTEMLRAMERHETGEAHVIPILLRPVDWQSAPFGKLQALPSNGTPITKWRNRDAAFANVVQGIRVALEDIQRLALSTPPTSLPRVWSIPYRRNPYFTGRDVLFDQIDQYLAPTEQNVSLESRRVALTQPHAIKGLGGIGKTQIAVEYAYRSREQGHYTHTFWVNAAGEETIIASFVEIAELLPAFPTKSETDQRKLIEAVKRWLEKCNERWLLIFDNADDITLVRDYIPKQGFGSIVLTTRTHAVGSLATSVEVETMGFLEGTQLLLRRAQRFEQASDDEINQAGNIVVALDHFPLALDQAGAYIEETQCSFTDYLKLYQTHRQALLAQRGTLATDYPHSVATTWLLSFEKVQQANPAAAELLDLCSFLAPDRIPEELLRDGATHWPVSLQQAVADPFLFQQLIAELLKFSLVKRLVEDHVLSIHRLVQAVQRDRMESEAQRQWAERAIRAINTVFPRGVEDPATWPQCLRYLDQAEACYALIEHYEFAFVEAANVLGRTGSYLDDHALYAIAEPLYQRTLAIREQTQGAEHPETAISLNNLAGLYESQGKYGEAESLYLRSLKIREERSGAEHPGTATVLTNLAYLYQRLGRYVEAELLYQRALKIREERSGVMHPDTANTLENLATLYSDLGRYAEAEPLFERALAICEQELGDTHPNTANCINALAVLYYYQDKYEEAEPLFERTLAICEQVLGATHPLTAGGLDNLAMLYLKQGKYVQAEPLSLRALAICEQSLGPEHPDTALSLQNLATLYRKQGRYAQAELLFQRALTICKQQLGQAHPRTHLVRNNYITLLRSTGRDAEANELAEDS